MSDNILRIIPSDPNYIPNADTYKIAIDTIKALFPTETVRSETSENVQFIDAGENWGEIKCPNCNGRMDMEWWAGAMGDCAETEFQSLQVKAPCCGSVVSLNDLKYEFTVGFAKFVLEVYNPGKFKQDYDDIRQKLEVILKALRKTVLK